MGKIIINRERCKGCGLCIHFCKKKQINLSDELNYRGQHPCVFIDAGDCNGCAICAIVCPDVAIEVYK